MLKLLNLDNSNNKQKYSLYFGTSKNDEFVLRRK